MGQCCASLLALGAPGAVSFVGRFLESDNEDVQVEAASALAQCRDPHALELLQEFWQDLAPSLEVRRALLISLGASPLVEAAEFLLGVVASESADLAASAITALAASRYHGAMRERIGAAVRERGDALLTSTFDQTFRPQ